MNEGAMSNVTIGAETLQDLYVTMRRIRAFEDKTADLFEEGVVKGTAHSYKGEEAIAAGVCEALRDDDIIASYHRGHGHCIAKGARIDRMMAELMGRQTGYCQGLGGSMHIADMELNIMGANGIVGAAMPLATGAGLAAKLQGTDRVAVAFFGDGASNQGVFHESLNLAAVWKLPVIFVCENNQYALSTSYRNTTSVSQVANRAASYEIPGITVDGNDGVEVYLVLREAVERARAGEGPTLIEAMTYRHGQHSLRVNLRDPRPEEELESWLDRDPIVRMEKRLTGEGGFTDEQLSETGRAVEEELETAVSYGRDSPEPPVQVMLDAVYAPHAAHTEPGPDTERTLSYPEALNEALNQEMLRDDRVFLMGEDVGATGGIFGVSAGLMDRYGPERVRDTPISEATFVGCGVGAAIAGMRPVVEIQIFDFVALTMDMLVNQAAKFRFMLGGKPSVPLVVRGPQGGGIRLAAQHSQSLEAWFTHVPGLVVAAPSTPYDAKGLLVAAIRDDNP
ncbi:MAG: thiamine pyrophosphate-dependent enzyme, partial [Rhodospirillales bacterium]|nr:thiamine pyrophosphate-dependent enzyme [Rhodospirillales bacterium]